RVASLAVMAMLSFGVVAGSLTGPGGVEALARSIVVSVNPPAAPAPAPAPTGGGGGGGGGGAGPQRAITETITQPAPPSSSPGTTPPAGTTGTTGTTGTVPSGSAAVSLPPIKHVFMVMLSDQGFNQTFGATKGHPYLSSTLRRQGELITQYYGVAPSSLASEIALISGQGPTQDTAANCPTFTNVVPTGNAAGAQVIGNGCVYPQTTQSLPAELSDNGNTWRTYIQGIDQGPAGQLKSCRHPAQGVADPNQAATATDPYVTHLNPFVYFGALTTGTQCTRDDVGIDKLAKDLKHEKTTPNFSYIAPGACDDGSDTPCTTGATAGLVQADKFLKTVIPEIKASPAYKHDGMIIVTFDQAPQTGANADSSSCCDQPTFPNLAGSAPTTTASTTTGATTAAAATQTTTTAGTTTPGATTTQTTSSLPAATTPTSTTTTPTSTATTPTDTTTTTTATPPVTGTAPPATTTSTTITGTTTTATTTTGATSAGTPTGGGQVGAVVISRYVKAGSEDAADTFNHFSLLKTIEDLFSIPKLGYSKDTSLPEFDTAVFNNYTAG
ncbi:MAG: alkaline phosphatase family protein, partial [Solirubrobacteraceae bacterium]